MYRQWFRGLPSPEALHTGMHKHQLLAHWNFLVSFEPLNTGYRMNFRILTSQTTPWLKAIYYLLVSLHTFGIYNTSLLVELQSCWWKSTTLLPDIRGVIVCLVYMVRLNLSQRRLNQTAEGVGYDVFPESPRDSS